MKRAYRRRSFVVDTFQIRLLLVSFAHLAIFALVVAGVLFLPLMMKLQDATLTTAEKGRVAEEFLSLDVRFWPAVLVVLAVIAVHSVLVSHRIAGPLVGFRRVMKAVGEGDLSVQARIRRRDYLRQDAESINAMISGLRERLREAQEEVETLCAAWNELRVPPSGASASEVARRVEVLGARVHRLRDRLNELKIGA